MHHQDDNAVRMGSVPLFTPTVPPKITSISHDFLVKWKVKRRATGEDFDAVLTPIIEIFNAELLDAFCDLRLRTPTADVT
ncbi:unnamed protein product [Phytophthora fragariaefolia]|uniref:Unnamed protein product n=1 Tax=Phytophthora fragariaefolia TaxID=1490495 RepID=A0A9W6TW34_9STRA|nr:unnamed protein product [Phytophthora fragariaefolia]